MTGQHVLGPGMMYVLYEMDQGVDLFRLILFLCPYLIFAHDVGN